MGRKDIRIAYLLQVHKNPDQLNKFIRQISEDGHSDVYVHIDKKSFDAVSTGIIKAGNIKIVEESVDVKWGDISQVDATLCLLRGVEKSGQKYDFVCLRSGQDLLVRNALVCYLEANKNKIFMNARKLGNAHPDAYFWKIKWPRFTRKRYDSVLHPCRILRSAFIRLYKFGINIMPNPNRLPLDPYRGSQWFCIPGIVAEYIVDYLGKNPWYYETFKNALAPDEYFFQTIIMNSPYASDVVCNNLTYIRFGRSHRDNNHPVTLTMKNIPEIEKSEMFFARKFDQAVDNEVIEYFCRRCASP